MPREEADSIVLNRSLALSSDDTTNGDRGNMSLNTCSIVSSMGG